MSDDERKDTVIVAAREAYRTYLETSAYVCQRGRSFREEVKYLGFYKDKVIQREVPAILARLDNVLFTKQEAERLRASEDGTKRTVGELIDELLLNQRGPWDREGLTHQVFLLSSNEDLTLTLMLQQEIRHTGRGAWTQGQRYTSSAALKRGPGTMEELEAKGG